MIDFAEWVAMAEHQATLSDEEHDAQSQEYADALIVGMADVQDDTLTYLATDVLGVLFKRNPLRAHHVAKVLHEELCEGCKTLLNELIADGVSLINAEMPPDIAALIARARASNGDSATE